MSQSRMISTPKSISREPKKKLGMYCITLMGRANNKNSAPAHWELHSLKDIAAFLTAPGSSGDT